jgi:hypothetical protein
MAFSGYLRLYSGCFGGRLVGHQSVVLMVVFSIFLINFSIFFCFSGFLVVF